MSLCVMAAVYPELVEVAALVNNASRCIGIKRRKYFKDVKNVSLRFFVLFVFFVVKETAKVIPATSVIYCSLWFHIITRSDVA